MKETNCILCGRESQKTVLDISQCEDTYLNYLEIPYQGNGRRYNQCERCGLVYRNPVLEPAEKVLLYKKFRDQQLRGESLDDYFKRISSIEPSQSENFEKYQFLKKYIGDSGEILDVGAGVGVFLYGFKRYFPKWNVTGIDPTEGVARIAGLNGVIIHEKYLNGKTFNGQSFDLITSIHVLEHTDDMIEYLKTIRNYMKDHTLLYLETPAVEDIGFLSKCHDRFMCQHEYIFSNTTLCNLLKNEALDVVFSEVFLSRRKRYNLRAICRKVKGK